VNELTTDPDSEVVNHLWQHIAHSLKLLTVTDEQRVVMVTAAATASNVNKLMTIWGQWGGHNCNWGDGPILPQWTTPNKW